MPAPKRQTPVPAPAPAPPRGGVLGRIKPMATEDRGIKMLLYGRSSTGKTTLWSTFPGKILAVICSGGVHTGELLSVDTPANRKKIDTVTLENGDELGELMEAVESDGRYKTVVLDHAAGYQDLRLKEVLGLKDVPLSKNWGLASQQQYGMVVSQCKEAFRLMLNVKANVVFVGHERTFGDGRESEAIDPSVGVGLFPKLAEWLTPACDYVCQTCIRPKVNKVKTTLAGQEMEMEERIPGEYEYCLRTGPDPVYHTKFRIPREFISRMNENGSLPQFIVDPSYDKIMSLIRGE